MGALDMASLSTFAVVEVTGVYDGELGPVADAKDHVLQ